MKTDRRTPAEGEVWASPCHFSKKDDGSEQLRPGVYNTGEGEDPVWAWDVDGYEVRTVKAVVSIAGHQRRVIYTRQYAPDGHAPFGRKELKMTALSAFNSWRRGTQRRHMKPATLVQESHVETAVKALEAA
jgi:hypothetical protein